MIKDLSILITFFYCLTVFTGCKGEDKERSNRPGVQPGDLRHIEPKAEYTRNSPDEWEGLEDSHIPEIVPDPNDTDRIWVRVNLKESGPNHYIEKIGIMDKDKKDLAGEHFGPERKYFETRFPMDELPSEKKGLKLYAKCNLHDLWTVPLEEAIKGKK